MSSVKCPQCGLVNWTGATTCSRCGIDLKPSAEAAQGEAAFKAQQSRKPNLHPCPDCEHLISRSAESCPQCGRYIQRFALTIEREGWTSTIGWGILYSGFLLLIINIVVIAILFIVGSSLLAGSASR